MRQTTLEKILSIGFLVAILGINITLLLLSFSSRQQREELQKGNERIECILLIDHDKRTKESVRVCDK